MWYLKNVIEFWRKNSKLDDLRDFVKIQLLDKNMTFDTVWLWCRMFKKIGNESYLPYLHYSSFAALKHGEFSHFKTSFFNDVMIISGVWNYLYGLWFTCTRICVSCQKERKRILFTYTTNYSPLLRGSNFGFPASNRFFPGR